MITRPYEVVDAGDLLVIGGGLAGLSVALAAAPARVTVISPPPLGVDCASSWAQGGIAAAVGAGDNPEDHAADTRVAGCDINDGGAVSALVSEAADFIDLLARRGVPFARDGKGAFALGREAAHSRSRIVNVAGDRSGAAVMETMAALARQSPRIRIVEGVVAEDLALAGGCASGAWVRRLDDPAAWPVWFRAGGVVLATGGIGRLFDVTTNPSGARGGGLAMAARAGAMMADLEFVQFHPTAIDVGTDPTPLASEALRGAGAVLIDERGRRFMADVHPDAELAPRDVVARTVFRQRAAGRRVYLDATRALGGTFHERYPTIHAACVEAGIEPAWEPIPVAPAAHYHMGGVATDLHGRTSVPGLWACGEVASTGVHGANRLASNSLLEAGVFAHRVAEDATGVTAAHHRGAPRDPMPCPLWTASHAEAASERVLRRLMSDKAGVVRDGEGLRTAMVSLAVIERRAASRRLSDMALVGRLIATAAERRQESRGGHFRSDCPEESPAWRRRSYLTLAEADAVVLESTAGALEQLREVGT